MDERNIILKCREYLNNADEGLIRGRHDLYCQYISNLLDFLLIELVGGASNETQSKIDSFC